MSNDDPPAESKRKAEGSDKSSSSRKVPKTVPPLVTVETLAGIGPIDCRAHLKRGGDDAVGRSARFNRPRSIASGSDGSLFILDHANNSIRRCHPSDGIVTTFCENLCDDPSSAADGTHKFGDICVVPGPDGDEVFLADSSDHCIKRISPTGIIKRFVGGKGLRGCKDGRGIEAKLDHPHGLVASLDGTLFVSQSHAIRRISPAGEVTTITGGSLSGDQDGDGGDEGTARFGFLFGLALSHDGGMYVADSRRQHCIRWIGPDGVTETVAGGGSAGRVDGRGAVARFDHPDALALAADGTLFISEFNGHCIRMMSPAGDVTTLCGAQQEPGRTPACRDGDGSTAFFCQPDGIAIDLRGGALYVCDSSNHSIRVVRSRLIAPPMLSFDDAAGMTMPAARLAVIE